MKIKKMPQIYRAENGTLITIEAQSNDFNEALKFAKKLEKANGDIEFDLTVKQRRKHRSLDANAYLWVLIGKLAEAQNITSEDVYKLQIKDYGVYEIVPIREEAVEQWVRAWSSKGIGWVCDDLGESKHEGYRNIRSYYGTSVYDSKQMSRIIDGVVYECKLQGIDTMTPDELKRIKGLWQT